ncbi:hypothetical protein APHAL10511_006113 [Amanita phalloides]|nr:hypothetical protein APHAL10511_006113 [Amanita phalloides]
MAVDGSDDERFADDSDDAAPSSSTLYKAVLALGVNTFRAYAPQVVPLVVCTLLIPLIVAISLLAGWLVWKNAAVSWEVPLYLQYGDASQPYAQVLLPSLVLQQRYDISVQLVVPLTEPNLALGNFMTSLSLSTPSNKTLISVRRPTLILPQVSFFSSKPSFIKLDVPLLKAYLPSASKLVANVKLGRKDGWTSLGRGEGREVSILEAHIRGATVHHGIRGLTSRFPLISALLSAASFFLTLSVMLSVCILPNVLHGHAGIEHTTASVAYGRKEGKQSDMSDASTSDAEDKYPRGRRVRTLRRRQSRGSGERTEIKTEENDSIPLARIKSEPLRRRPSRRTGRQSDSDS